MIIGHSISSVDGIIQAIDQPVAALLQRSQAELIGKSYTVITHPDDVAQNMTQIAALRANGQTARIQKRYICGDGAIIRLDVQVSRLGSCENGHLVGTLSTIPVIPDELDRSHKPYQLWQRARDLLGIVQARDAVLGDDLFADHAWKTLLLVYVAEAEGRIVNIDTLADHLRLSRATFGRWLRVLQTKSLIEPVVSDLDALQLTKTGIDGVERLLATQEVRETSE